MNQHDWLIATDCGTFCILQSNGLIIDSSYVGIRKSHNLYSAFFGRSHIQFSCPGFSTLSACPANLVVFCATGNRPQRGTLKTGDLLVSQSEKHLKKTLSGRLASHRQFPGAKER
jgi:hypothetical protein